MNKTILIIISIISFTCFAQDLSKSDLSGAWKVHQIVNSPNDIQFQSLSEGFQNATFSFHNDGKFNISTTFNTPVFNIFTEKANNTQWIFDSNTQYIKIGNQKNQYSIMGIIVKQKEDKIYFYLDETELVMEMKKQ